MGVWSWLEKRKAKLSSSGTSNQNKSLNSNGNQIKQQHHKGKSLNESIGRLGGSDGLSQKPKDTRIEDTPIRQLWDFAYEKLREEDSALIADYESKLTGSVAAGLGQTLQLKANKREWMQAILQSKMDGINKNASELKIGHFEARTRAVMQLVLNIVNSANDYIASATSVNSYTSIAWTGISFYLPLLMNISAEQTFLVKGLDYIASLVTQSRMREELYVECYESGTSSSVRFRESHVQYKTALEKLYRHILRFQATGCCYYSKKSAVRYGLDAVKWNDWAPLVDEIREQERNFTAVEEKWRDIQRFEERLAVINSFSVMNSNLSTLTNQDFTDLLRWLCDIDPSSMYNAARDRHEAGTCEWLIKDSEEFKNWETSDRSLLWLHGKAGSGKSILTSSVIKHLQERCASEPSDVISYFYFSFSDHKTQEVDSMLASLIKQICSHQPHTSQLIQRLRGYKIKGERPDTETLEAILIDSASEFTNFYIVIDALDECPLLNMQRAKLLKSLRRILAIAPTNLHMFLTSRRESDIEGKIRSILSSPDRIEIDLLPRHQILNKDIDRYIHSQLSTEDYATWPQSVKEEARELLISNADCMFQYVWLQLEALRNLSSKADIHRALRNLPTGLAATYDRILETIDPNFREQVIHSLKWLAFSMDELHIEELAEIFIMRPRRDNILHVRERLFSPTDTLKYFSGLIVTQKDVFYKEMNGSTYVRLVHFSLKEYLISSSIAGGPSSTFSFTEMNAHLSIAQSCLAYLKYLDPWVTSHRGKYLFPRIDISAYPLARYAVNNWMIHLEKIPCALWSPKITRDAASALAVHSENLLTLLKLVHFSPLDINEWVLKPYIFTAYYGHFQLTEMLIYPEPGVKKYVTREGLDEALQWMAYKGKTDMMQIFLKAGADVDAQCGKWGTALYAAASGGNLEALKLLVSNGADVSSPWNSSRCQLRDIPTDCLKFLLDSGADINIKDRFYGTVLHRAIEYWNDANFDLLLERGADVNAFGRNGTPLQAVCRSQSFTDQQLDTKKIARYVKKLLESGADPNTGQQFDTEKRARYMKKLLESVSDPSTGQQFHTEKRARYVKRLLESGADPNLRDGDCGTALQLACGNSMLFPSHQVAMEIVQLLIENWTVETGTVVDEDMVVHDAVMSTKGWGYGVERLAAANSVDPSAVDLVKLLLENDAKIDQSDFTGPRMALHDVHVACFQRNEEKVRWLLDHGADVNAESGLYGTPLQALLGFTIYYKPGIHEAWNHLEEKDHLNKVTLLIVQLLINKGAYINQVNQKGTALQTACINPDINVEIVRFLLEHGADVNTLGGKFGSALGAACASKRSQNDLIQLVQLLIKHGADVNAKDENYRAPLTVACTYGQEELVRLLLESGANVHHNTYAAWYAADYRCSIDVLRRLFDQAIDINHVREEYGTVLYATMQEWVPNFIELQKWQDKVLFLLEHGADVNIKGGKYGFALQAACATTIPEHIVPNDINTISKKTKFLLEQCPNINVNAQGGMFGSALQAAAFSGQTESVRLLLDRRADVNARGGKYRSALNAAIIYGYWDIVEILLQAGATPDYRLQQQPDEEWLQRVQKECPGCVKQRRHMCLFRKLLNQVVEEDGRSAVARYRKFWEVESGSTAGLEKVVEGVSSSQSQS